MAFYLATYDLKAKDESDYQELWDEFDSMDSVKTQDSVYLVSSSKTQLQLFNRLKRHVHDDDRLMVITFTDRPSWTKGLKGTRKWIDKHFPV